MMKNINIVGILNLSPESFGSEAYHGIPKILKRVGEMIEQGATYIDVGAQSTRPGAVQLTLHEELNRLRGVIKEIKNKFPSILVSIDTTRKECVELSLSEGVDMINDISGGRFDKKIIRLITGSKVKYVLTHSQGNFESLHKKYEYANIIEELKNYFVEKITELNKLGIFNERIIIDPGIGFSKTGAQNIEIINRLEELNVLNLPVYIGVSRKKFIGEMIHENDPLKRDVGTAVVQAYCLQKGVSYVRTHNVEYMKQVLHVIGALEKGVLNLSITH